VLIRGLEEVNRLGRKGEPDILWEVLRAARLKGVIFWDNDARGAWASTTPTVRDVQQFVMPGYESVIAFHLVISGSFWIELADDPSSAICLTAGEAVVFPGGDEHNLGSTPGRHEPPSMTGWDRTGRSLPLIDIIGSGTEACRFVCGFLGYEAGPFNSVLSALPRMFRGRPSAASVDVLTGLLESASPEGDANQARYESALASVAEVMFTEVVRGYSHELADGSRGWLAALRNPHISAALRLIHASPADPWTVERLARKVGLSRSRFAERFATLLGVSPMQYLARWRMQLAVRILDEKRSSIAQVAAEVGYQSEAAFQRAFKKCVGTPPGLWRKESRGGR
jgi:AraC-like DNA-binding protein